MTIVLRRAHVDQIAAHGRQVFPVEACGIISGRNLGGEKLAEKVHPATNILNSLSGYQVDPEQQLRIFDEADAGGLEVLGFYHSHPYWAANYSEVDRALAAYPGFSYLIYSLPDKELKSWLWNGGEFQAEPIRVIE